MLRYLIFPFAIALWLLILALAPKQDLAINDTPSLFGGTLSADVLINNNIFATAASTETASPTIVHVSDTDIYAFFRVADGGVSMASSTDSGATWSTSRKVDSVNTTNAISVAIWYDRWTKGDTGNIIHIATIESVDNDDAYYTQLNLSTGALSTSIITTTQAATCTGGSDCAISITKAENGVLYMAVTDASDTWVQSCSSTCTSTANWSERTGAFGEFGNDPPMIVPVPGTNNVMLVWWDISADTIDYNVYSATSSSWFSTVGRNIATVIEDNTTYDGQLIGMTAATTTGLIYLTFTDDANDYTTQDHDIDFWTFSTTTWTWTQKTDVITTASGGLTGAKVSYDATNNTLYSVYTRRTTITTPATGNIYFRTSTNGGTSWSAESSAINNLADNINGLSINILGVERIGAHWNYSDATRQFDQYYDDIADLISDGGGGGTPVVYPNPDILIIE